MAGLDKVTAHMRISEKRMSVSIISRARITALAAAAAGCLAVGTGSALANSTTVEYFRNRAQDSDVPSVLGNDERAYYRQVHEAIDRKDWAKVQQLFEQRRGGLLHQHAKAEYFLAASSPKIELPDLEAWLRQGTGLPRADQIARLAVKRGAQTMPALPAEQRFERLATAPRRVRPATVRDGTMPARISSSILEHIRNDDPVGAQQLLDGIDAMLSASARAEWRQRVAWSYYIENQDAQAYRLAQLATAGAGAWVAEAWWTAGLSAWRLGDCDGAGDAFLKAAGLANNPELSAAGYYWQARSLIRCRRPEQAAEALRGAAHRDDTLYGMLAAEQLGLRLTGGTSRPDFSKADWQILRHNDNVRVAVGLAEIGRDGQADEVLRHQARIGAPSQFAPLTRLARDLGLPSTQLWMSYNAPRGARPDPATRFPTPNWVPKGGWSVDPALVYAHALQESRFRAAVVSPAGARGLMQIMPATARQHAPALGVAGSVRNLNDPQINLAYGQIHLEMLNARSGTQGLLPKVMAAYNAGLTPVTRWNSEVKDQGDALLWMESIPYWETRGYVNIVMRNYWMYERQAGDQSESRKALAQGMWPTFPGLVGSKGVRMAENGVLLRGN